MLSEKLINSPLQHNSYRCYVLTVHLKSYIKMRSHNRESTELTLMCQNMKMVILQSFDYLPVRGRVKLSNPDVCLQYIEYYGSNPNKPPEKPILLFFGRLVSIFAEFLIQKLHS